jgi:hypothetical protein
MDEALKKIEQVLKSERTFFRLEKLLPQAAEPPKPPEQEIGITHYTKPKAEAPEPAAPAIETVEPPRFERPAEVDPAAKIGVGAREFTLDELGGSAAPASDPLMGQVLKPSTFREMTLDDLSSGNGTEE